MGDKSVENVGWDLNDGKSWYDRKSWVSFDESRKWQWRVVRS